MPKIGQTGQLTGGRNFHCSIAPVVPRVQRGRFQVAPVVPRAQRGRFQVAPVVPRAQRGRSQVAPVSQRVFSPLRETSQCGNSPLRGNVPRWQRQYPHAPVSQRVFSPLRETSQCGNSPLRGNVPRWQQGGFGAARGTRTGVLGHLAEGVSTSKASAIMRGMGPISPAPARPPRGPRPPLAVALASLSLAIA